jgi:hypothetical protein
MKLQKNKRKIIKPLRAKCDCGKKVKNHHFLCDSCWGKKERKKHSKIQNKIVKEAKRAKKKLKQLEKQNDN